MNSASKPIDYREQVEQLLSESVESVRRREQSAFDELLASADNRIVLFGAGILGRKVLGRLRSVGIEPLAFADNNQARWGSTIEGVPVLSPSSAAEKFGSNALFMVTIWSRGHTFCETYEQLSRLQCKRVVPTSLIRWKFAAEMLPDLCQDLPHKMFEDADAARAGAWLWSDDRSRQEYLNHLKWRAFGDMGALGMPDPEESYFLASRYRMLPGEVLVDCGAYDGDTIKRILCHAPKFERIYAVEADPANFRLLQDWAKTLDPEIASRIELHNVAVGASHGHVRFAATGGEDARVSSDGDVVVDCVPLDELAGESMPTFIKMDIEGFELEALQGARDIIQKQEPILSICAYHRQSDLWRIPLYIRSLVDDYHLFLRTHDGDGCQLVCYAVPAKRLQK